MSKHTPPMPLRTSADHLGDGWFILEDFGHGSYHLRMTPEGMTLLNDYGEAMHPLNALSEREFIGLCSILDSALCMAIDFLSPPDDDEERVFTSLDPHDELPF